MNNQKSINAVEINIDLLRKFFNKSCNTFEREKVIDYFRDPSYERILKIKLKECWDDFKDYPETGVDSELMLDRIYSRMHAMAWEERKNMHFLRKIYHGFSRIAAVLILPLLLVGGWLYLRQEAVLPEAGTSYVDIYSPPGARTHFDLPDGSSGWLNSDSRLKFAADFTGSDRDVILSGEGYFNVVGDPDKPFIVRAGNSSVIALGTSFNVAAWPDEDYIYVTLESGKVVFNKTGQDQRQTVQAELQPGEQIKSWNKSDIYHKMSVDTKNFTSWKEGKLVFRNEDMTEILKRLERWYNVEFIIQDDVIKSYRYRATFQDETLEEILRLLEKTSPMGYQEMDREVQEDGTYSKKIITLFKK